jgi:ligand-binding sensor domain-containing protein
MNTQFKVNLPKLIILAAITFAAFGCEQKNTVEENKETNKEESIWQQTALDTFSIEALAVGSDGSILAGTCGNGIFRSMDRGESWISVSKGCAVTFAIRDNGDIFATLQAGYMGSNNLLRSMDNGATWKLLGAPANSITRCVFNAAGEIFVSGLRHDESRGGIYRSVDNGDHWLKIFPDSVSVNALAVNKEGVIFAGTGLGIVRSFDNGQTWRQINNGFRRGPYVYNIAINSINGDIFVVNAYDGIYRSSNNGDSWLLTGLTVPPIGGLITVSLAFNSMGYAFAGIELYSTDPLGVFYSTDNGINWSPFNSGLTNKIIIAITIDGSGYLYAGTDGNGVFRTIKSTTTR